MTSPERQYGWLKDRAGGATCEMSRAASPSGATSATRVGAPAARPDGTRHYKSSVAATGWYEESARNSPVARNKILPRWSSSDSPRRDLARAHRRDTVRQ